MPLSLKKVIIEKLHIAHQDIQRTKAKARKSLYCPGMAQDIEIMVEKCAPCQQLQPWQQKEPLISHDVPELPWLKVGVDIFELRGQSYLLLMDYLTKISRGLCQTWHPERVTMFHLPVTRLSHLQHHGNLSSHSPVQGALNLMDLRKELNIHWRKPCKLAQTHI